MRAVGTHCWPTRMYRACYRPRHRSQIRREGEAGTTILNHLHNYRRTLPIQRMTTGWMELLENGHRRHYRKGSRTLRLTTAGRTEQRAGEAGVIQLQADCTTTRPHGSGPTRQSDAGDSEPMNMLQAPRHGPGLSADYSGGTFTADQPFKDQDRFE